MKKERFYKICIAVLLLLNLLQLAGFLFLPKPPKPKKGNFKQEAINILRLTPQQEQAFFKSAEKHHTAMTDLVKKQKELTAEYFKNPSELLLTEINQIETQKIKITETNFNEIEHFLQPNQKEKFKQFKEKALKIILQ